MSTEGTARLRVAVAFLCVAATAALVSLGASFVRLNGVFPDPEVLYSGPRSPRWSGLLLIMAIAGVVGAAAGLIVIHRARRTGWPVLLLIGTVLTAAHLLPLLGVPLSLYDRGAEVVLAGLGAGSILVILGLLGAASWLIHSGSSGFGCLVAGVALAGPAIGLVVLSLIPIGQVVDLASMRVLDLTLSGIGIAGAIGVTALIPLLRRLPEPEPPPATVTVVGGIAAAVAIAPVVVIQFARSVFTLTKENPSDPDPYRTEFDENHLMLGMAGLAVFVAGICQAAVLGSRALGAALAAGLALYAAPLPLGVALRSIDSRAAVGVLVTVGLVLAGLAAAARWRAWFAGGAGGLVGVVVVVVAVGSGGDRVSPLIAGCLLVLALVALIGTVAASAAAVADRSRVPAVIGTVAVAIQLGLVYTGTLVWHTGISGEPRSDRPAHDVLTLASGIALLFGALLVVVLPLIRPPAPAPDAPDPDQAVPVAR